MMELKVTLYKNASEYAHDEIRVRLDHGVQRYEHRFPVPRLPHKSDLDMLFDSAMAHAKAKFFDAMRDHYDRP